MLFSPVLSAQGVIFNSHLRRLVLSEGDFKIPAVFLCIKCPMATSVWGGKKGDGGGVGVGGAEVNLMLLAALSWSGSTVLGSIKFEVHKHTMYLNCQSHICVCWTLPNPMFCGQGSFPFFSLQRVGGWQVLFREVILHKNIKTAHPMHVCTELFQTLCFVGKGHSHSFHSKEWGGDRFCSER